ncbi:uracil-xanthine permease family protein [Lutispora saccharofermentans]|uniref:Purine/pyrimidine permease n=1 Tax=Lutispora saccharofermentans TaxID=3024236 RepID=A0ABT1NDH6_9FIRM|nr:solute carrier family 23 protein [Lutispora saccharofermentans]MCQ1529119.1 purine/pyrimidine permease [Lutispora saccharofermentans]
MSNAELNKNAVLDPQEQPVWEENPRIVKPILGIDDKPNTWWESLLYGWQHTLVDISPFVLPLLVATAAGLGPDEGAVWVSRGLFGMGLATLLQTTFGNKLPIIQGPSATVTGALTSVVALYGMPAMWGAILVGGIIEMLLGATRVLGVLRKMFPVVVSGVVVMSIGYSLGRTAVGWMIGDGSASNFILAAATILLIFILQFTTKNIANGIISRGSIFFSIWIIGLGLAGVMGKVDWALVASKPWFAFPGFFPYGGPGFGWKFIGGAIIGVFVGYLGSIVESIGDYAATCAVSGETYRVKHMNKGIMAEGLGCIIASIFGGIPVSSYTQNIGIISTTKIASRYVVKVSACILLLYGLSPKFGALLVAIPRSIIGAVFVIVCGSIVTSGIQLVSSAKPTTANSFLVGTTMLFAVGIPVYATYGISEWTKAQTPLIQLFLTNTVVIAVLVGIVLHLLLNVAFKGEQEEIEE